MPRQDGTGPDGKGPRRKFRNEWDDEDEGRCKNPKKSKKRDKNIYKKYIDNDEDVE